MQPINHLFALIPPAHFESMVRRGLASYTADDLVYLCERCGVVEPRPLGNGFVRGECACERQARYNAGYALYKQDQYRAQQVALSSKTYTWLGPDYQDLGVQDKTFANFKVPGLNSKQSYAWLRTQEYAESPRGNLILWSEGQYGTGKTHLAAAICNDLRARCKPCLFTSGPNFFNALQGRISAGWGTSDILQQAYSTPLLVIDDIDKAHRTTSGYREEVYWEIINTRTNRGLAMILTANTEDLSPYIGGAAASRLQVGFVKLNMAGADYRSNFIAQ